MVKSNRYASGTRVAPDRSRAEIESTLVRYGVTHYGVVTTPDAAVLAFQLAGQNYRITLPLPNPQDRKYTRTSTGQARAATPARQAYEQDVRARWRVLLLVIKARLEMATLLGQPIADALVEHRVLGDGRTVAEAVRQDGTTPPALTWGGA